MFTIRNNVRIAKFCSELQKMFPFSKIVHRSKNMFAFFKFCSKFQKMFAFSIFRLKFYEMFLFFKICSTLQKNFAVFQKFVHRSKNVQHFKIIIRYFWNCPRSKKDTGFENELRFSCKKKEWTAFELLKKFRSVVDYVLIVFAAQHLQITFSGAMASAHGY